MPWSYQRSRKIGPLRLNFSKSGVGASVGVRGLRFGTGPRGRYVSGAGPFGMRFRAKAGTDEARQFVAGRLSGYALGLVLAGVVLYFAWPLLVGGVLLSAILKSGGKRKRRRRW